MAKITLSLRVPSAQQIRSAVRESLKTVGVEATSIIKTRTAKGISADGGQFRPYTPAYARLKRLSGRKSDPPDLTVSGKLLGNLKVLRITDDLRVVIGFEGQHLSRPLRRRGAKKRKGAQYAAQSVPYATLVEALDRLRPFFRITRQDELQRLARAFEREMTARLRALPRK